MDWIVILILVIAVVIILAFLKFRAFSHKTLAIIIIVLLIFFYISASAVLKGQNANLKSFDGVMKGVKIYGSWLYYSVFGNVKSLAGNAIKMDWGVKNTYKNSSSPSTSSSLDSNTNLD